MLSLVTKCETLGLHENMHHKNIFNSTPNIRSKLMATHWKRNVHYENQLSQKYPTNRERDIATRRLSGCNYFSMSTYIMSSTNSMTEKRSVHTKFSTKTASFSKRVLNVDFSVECSSTLRSNEATSFPVSLILPPGDGKMRGPGNEVGNEVMWLFNWWFSDVRTKANWISHVEVDIRVQQASGCFGYHQASYVS